MKNNLPIIIVPKSVSNWLDKKNPDIFIHEEMAHLFGILLPGKFDGKEVLIITHAYNAPGINRSFANVNTNKGGVRERLQLISNGLTITGKALGLEGHTIGTWHTHPSSADTQPSYDDINTYTKSSKLSGMGFWLGPIACRNLKRKYTRWFMNIESTNELLIMPDDHIVTLEDEEILKLDKRLTSFLEVNPEYFLVDVHDFEEKDEQEILTEKKEVKEHHSDVIPLPKDLSTEALKPRRLAVNILASTVMFLTRINWFEVAALCALVTSLMTLILLTKLK